MAKYITPAKYADIGGKWGYAAEYAEYRTKKVRSYSECDECGHKEYLGWVEKQFPIGEPVRYRELAGMELSMALVAHEMAMLTLKNVENMNNVFSKIKP